MATPANEVPRNGRSGGQLDGVILIDKPFQLSSNAAVQSVRRLLGWGKAGHTGTLDPLATGLLLVCLGECTKFAGVALDADKTYEAVVRLGLATDSGDAEGAPVFEGPVAGCLDRLPEVLAQFRGGFDQLPPMFSALKHNGRPLYAYARAGAEVPRAPRPVRVERLEIISSSEQEVIIEIRCSKGMYVRTLAHDIGMRLGCGAHLRALRRTHIGRLSVIDAISLDALTGLTPAQRLAHVRPADLILLDLPLLTLDDRAAQTVLQGRQTETPSICPRGAVRLYDAQGNFLGLGLVQEDNRVAPKRMCSRRLPGIARSGPAALEGTSLQSVKWRVFPET